MAIPTTQKECTTRRIAALIIGLWDKVKNAFQTKLPTTGTPSSTYSIGITGNSSTSDYPSGFNSRSTTTSWGTVNETNGYTTVTRWATNDTAEIVMGKKEKALSVQIDGMYYQNEGQYQVLDTSSRGAANGVASLDANGKVPSSQIPNVYRTFPKLNFFDHGENQETTIQFIKVAEISCNGAYLNHPILFRVMSRYQGQCSIYIQLEETSSKYPGIANFRVLSPYERGKSYAIAKMTYVDDSTHRVYSLWVNPGSWTHLESVVESDITSKPLITMISGVYSTSLTNPIEPSYQKEIFTKNAGNRVGSESVPVFVESTGEVKPCTNVPVIEHVTSIPVNPTVGTIYAI